MLTVGEILKPHGVRGEVKLRCFLDSPEMFREIKKVCVGKTSYEVLCVKTLGEFVLLKLKDVDTVEQANGLRGKEVTVERANAPKLKDGRYYIADVLGANVFVGDKNIGILQDILQYSKTDTYCVKGEREVMFPLIKDLLISVDIETKTIVLNESVFQSVAVYDDD